MITDYKQKDYENSEDIQVLTHNAELPFLLRLLLIQDNSMGASQSKG